MAGTGTAHLRAGRDVLLRAENLTVEYPAAHGRTVHAVSDLSIDIVPRETLGLVGESGCGKSSVGRALLQLPPPNSGSVVFADRELTALGRRELRAIRPQIQPIFQDPISSLNPRRSVAASIEEVLIATGRGGDAAARRAAVDAVLTSVGVDPDTAWSKRPYELSGGQCQRISIARALIAEPRLLICDEAVSALDVSVQAQILNLLEVMKDQFGLTMLFITHDLAVVHHISDRIAVMYLGRLCEVGPSEQLFAHPAHPYTALLLASLPSQSGRSTHAAPVSPAPERVAVEMPSPTAPPSGCRFRTRCPRADERCATEVPTLTQVAPDQYVACHFPLDTSAPVTLSKTS